jgi:hypothetical protein
MQIAAGLAVYACFLRNQLAFREYLFRSNSREYSAWCQFFAPPDVTMLALLRLRVTTECFPFP